MLTAPAGGKWVLVNSIQRRVYMHCGMCESLVQNAWSYYVGYVIHACVCLGCADALLITDYDDNEEAA